MGGAYSLRILSGRSTEGEMEREPAASRLSTAAWREFPLGSESWRKVSLFTGQFKTYFATSIALWGTAADAMTACCDRPKVQVMGRGQSQNNNGWGTGLRRSITVLMDWKEGKCGGEN